MDQFAGVRLTPQGFATMNRGDMFFPSGSVSSGDYLAINGAAPDLFGGRIIPTGPVAVPVTYLMPVANMRPHGPIGMPTPAASAGPLMEGVLR